MSDFDAVRSLIRERMVEQSIPSIAVAVARRGEILWEEAFGWADREQRRPATPHTLYSMASISKPITATALMLLVEQGRVDLDRPINDYLGDTPVTARVGDAADATVRRVANHTAGLPLHYHFFPADVPYPRPPVAETIRRYGSLVTAPGERYQYANLGYGLLDEVVARVSGRPFAEFLRREVFLPLGMHRASVDVAPGLEPYQAARYDRSRVLLPFYDVDHPGASSVFCSAHDLVRFGMLHLKTLLPDQKAILSPESIDAMQQPTAAVNEIAGYGVGWRVGKEAPGRPTVAHSGGMDGVNTTLELLPTEGLAVAVLANTSCDLPFVAAEKIIQALAPELGDRIAAARAAQKAKREAEEQERTDFRAVPELAGEWRGEVFTGDRQLPLTLWFRESRDVHVQLGSQLRTLLNDGRFNSDERRLTGKLLGSLGTTDADRLPHHVHLDLTLRGDVLNGAVVAVSLPEVRHGNALSHWAELRRVGGG